MGKGEERTDACSGQSMAPDNGKEGEGSHQLPLAAPCFGVKEEGKGISHPRRCAAGAGFKERRQSWGGLTSQRFPVCIHVPTPGGEEGMQPSLLTLPYISSPPTPPTPKFRVEGNNFLTLATIHYVYGSAPHPIPPLFPVLMKGKNVLLSFFIFPDW